MIRLYLKAYKTAELVELYNALSLVRSTLDSNACNNPAKDIDEALVYLSGYMDAREENKK